MSNIDIWVTETDDVQVSNVYRCLLLIYEWGTYLIGLQVTGDRCVHGLLCDSEGILRGVHLIHVSLSFILQKIYSVRKSANDQDILYYWRSVYKMPVISRDKLTNAHANLIRTLDLLTSVDLFLVNLFLDGVSFLSLSDNALPCDSRRSLFSVTCLVRSSASGGSCFT